jgi:hypothetical protein
MSSPPNDMTPQEEAVDLEPYDLDEDSLDEPRRIHRWIRIILVVLTVPWLLVFFVATQISPYTEDGDARVMGTHMQLGLPDCNFKQLTTIPCPSCGMTTSFCLLIRGDVPNSLMANYAGTFLASFGLLFIPWAFASAFFGRFVFIRSIEAVVFWLALVFLLVLFTRWGIVVILELTANT